MKIIAATEMHMSSVRELFREYQKWLDIDLCFHGFEEELAMLPGAYASPSGVILLAREHRGTLGCIAFRPRTRNEAELKRLYVRPTYQGQGIGKQLFHAAMSEASSIGYESMVLDTFPFMGAARALYKAYGFEKVPGYYHNPEAEVEYYRYLFE
ncbi:MAG: GNAT family N-acetyltransferase [Gammaproteobacteria bacterium]|nr:GNAT family N-acetyltransferase [Gammaproteobacteria bacterium]